MSNEIPQERSSSGFLGTLVVVGLLAIGFASLIRSSMTPTQSEQKGREFPPIEVAGWVNAPDESGEWYRGKVLVIDAWAYWCGPCRAATPVLQHLCDKYREQQVSFIGLTMEGLDDESLHKSLAYIKSEQVSWPNGYGAVKTFEALNADAIPQFWVVDRQNRIVTHVQGYSDSLAEELERGLVQALNSPATKSSH